MRSHVFQVHSLLFQELEGFINVLQAMDAHPSLSWFGLEGKRGRKTNVTVNGRKQVLDFNRGRWVTHIANCQAAILYAFVFQIQGPLCIWQGIHPRLVLACQTHGGITNTPDLCCTCWAANSIGLSECFPCLLPSFFPPSLFTHYLEDKSFR